MAEGIEETEQYAQLNVSTATAVKATYTRPLEVEAVEKFSLLHSRHRPRRRARYDADAGSDLSIR